MFKNYFTTTIRNIVRQKGYSIINILGLAIGFAAFILISLYVLNELSYDRFHDKSDRIFRVSVHGIISGDVLNVAVSAAPTGEAMVRDIPEIINVTRVDDFSQSVHFSCNDKSFYQEGLMYVDSTFFDIFSFRLLRGNPETVLVEPFSLVLTQSVATKYFGKDDPIGKSIRTNDKSNYTVTGIVEDPPANSHFHFKVLASFSTRITQNGPEVFNNWGSLSLYTYVLLAKGADPSEVETKFPELYLKYMDDLSELENIKFEPYLQPLTNIHLYSKLMAEIETNGDIGNVYAFSAIAIFILLIACINFMNLSTARSVKRAREVGLRKVVGAFRRQLIIQFIGESLLLGFLGLIIALIMVEIFLPFFNQLLDQNLSLGLFNQWYVFLLLIGFAIIVGVIAGSYPAFYLSSFHPIKVLKGTFSKGSNKSSVRNILVIIQFSISIFLMIATGLVYSQIQFLQSKKLGFNKEQLVVIPIRGEKQMKKIKVLKEEILNLSFVKNISASKFVPGRHLDGTGYIPEGYSENSPVIIFTNIVDVDYIETMEMKIVEGRGFSGEFSTDSMAVVINETLVKKLGWDDPIGKKISGFREDGSFDLHIIGVVNDFHFRSLHEIIEPTLMFMSPNSSQFLNVRLEAGNIKQHIDKLREKWSEIESAMPFDYYFLEQDFDNLYKAEYRTGEIFIYFTIIAIFIACLGLFGLASYNAEQKTKEIGIRKALGSSVSRIIIMLSKQFTKWVLIANILAWPAAFFFMNEWLSEYAYSIRVIDNWWIFCTSAFLAILIAAFAVTYQAVKAAYTNPVEAIKYE